MEARSPCPEMGVKSLCRYIMSKHMFQQVGQLNSDSMRHWDSLDDTSTLQSLPWLHAINRAGFVTTGSQVGLDQDRRQRAYLNGVVHGSHLPALRRLAHTTELLVRVGSGSVEPDRPTLAKLFEFGPKWPVTLRKGRYGAWEEHTWQPPAMSWRVEWRNILDDDVREDDKLRELCRKEGWVVYLLDPVWGRPFHLCQTLASALATS